MTRQKNELLAWWGIKKCELKLSYRVQGSLLSDVGNWKADTRFTVIPPSYSRLSLLLEGQWSSCDWPESSSEDSPKKGRTERKKDSEH